MPVSRHVWTFAEAEVEIYLERPSADPKIGEVINSAGTVIDPAVVPGVTPYCFMESGNLNVATQLVRRGVTGRGRRKIVHPASAFDEIQLTVGHLYFKKTAEFDAIALFKPRRQLRLYFRNVDWLYSGVAPLENDIFTLSFAFAQSFELSGQEADVMEGRAVFQAELLL